jgi:hypothetical protein
VRASLADGFLALAIPCVNLSDFASNGSAKALPGEIDSVRIMDYAIQDRVGIREIADGFVPVHLKSDKAF